MIRIELYREQREFLKNHNINTDYTCMTQEEAEEMFDQVEDIMQRDSDLMTMCEGILDTLAEAMWTESDYEELYRGERLCNKCKNGYMKPANSKIAPKDNNTFVCDNPDCRETITTEPFITI